MMETLENKDFHAFSTEGLLSNPLSLDICLAFVLLHLGSNQWFT
jgi:hypothetical protein